MVHSREPYASELGKDNMVVHWGTVSKHDWQRAHPVQATASGLLYPRPTAKAVESGRRDRG
jgi:hypothetical protein